MPALRLLVVCVLAAGALTVAGCGSDSDQGLLAAATADALTEDLDAVRDLAESGDCEKAATRALEFSEAVSNLDNTVDPELRRALADGGDRLVLNARSGDCAGDQGTDTTTTPDTGGGSTGGGSGGGNSGGGSGGTDNGGGTGDSGGTDNSGGGGGGGNDGGGAPTPPADNGGGDDGSGAAPPADGGGGDDGGSGGAVAPQ
ncbi:MAG: hypothetical protein ACR2NA_10560 [Solirubrobacterales bacterium]